MTDEGYQPFPDVAAWTAVPFDPTTYDQYAAMLEQARAEATEEAREHAVTTAIRYAGADTGAIEGLYTSDRGFTRSVAIKAAHWEAAANERGPNAAAIINDQIEAYEWVLDLVTQQRPVTEHMIRELHATLCRSQETYVVQTDVGRQERPLPKGEYKQFPNSPTSATTGRLHHYAPPDMVGPEMGRLVTSVSSDEYAAAHPVVQAAYLHYALAAIHPFADGNGRVSRALASVPLYRALTIPLVILRDERDEYFDALSLADTRRLDAWINFVAQRVTATASLVATTTTLGGAADRARTLSQLQELAIEARGLNASELRARAAAILEELTTQFREQFDAPNWPPTLTASSTIHFAFEWDDDAPLPEGYAAPERDFQFRRYTLENASPGHPRQMFRVGVTYRFTQSGATFAVFSDLRDAPTLFVDVAEANPQPRDSLRIKLRHWTEHVLDLALAHLTRAAAEAARDA